MKNTCFNFMLPNGISIDLNSYIEPLGLLPNDIIVASGTLVEGIGNEYSDIDIYVITDRYKKSKKMDISKYFRVISTKKEILKDGDDEDILLIHLPVEKTGIKVDVEFKTFSELETMQKTLIDNYNYAMSNHILLTKEMPERHLSFIHRIHHCICIYNEPGFEKLREGFNQSIMRYYLYRLNASDFSDLLDISGAWKKGELERCFDLARENLIKQLLAYLCLIGNTDYKRKWILTRLKQLNVESSIRDRFIELFLCKNVSSINQYILDTVDFIDKIYSLSAQFFEKTEDKYFPTTLQVMNWLSNEKDHCHEKYEHVEIEYRMKAYSQTSSWSTINFIDGTII